MKISHINRIIIMVIMFFPLFAVAQGVSYKITPKVIDREVKARDIITETVTIENYAYYKVNIFATVNVVSLDEGGDITEFTPPSMSDNTVTASSWIEINRGLIELLPGEKREIPLIIHVNPNASPGVYHVFVGFGTGQNRDLAEEQVRNGIAPGIIVTLSVGQDKTEFIKLGNFLVDRFVTTLSNEAISYTLKNPGTAEVVPGGEIIISNSRGDEVGTVPVNPDRAVLAPGEEVTYKATVPTSGLLGKYKALLSVDYGTSQLASVYDTAFFYIIPWKQLLSLFLVLLCVVIIASVILHRRYNGSKDDDDEHGAEYVPLYVRERRSEDKDHDINLKK